MAYGISARTGLTAGLLPGIVLASVMMGSPGSAASGNESARATSQPSASAVTHLAGPDSPASGSKAASQPPGPDEGRTLLPASGPIREDRKLAVDEHPAGATEPVSRDKVIAADEHPGGSAGATRPAPATAGRPQAATARLPAGQRPAGSAPLASAPAPAATTAVSRPGIARGVRIAAAPAPADTGGNSPAVALLGLALTTAGAGLALAARRAARRPAPAVCRIGLRYSVRAQRKRVS